jgi:molybdopterin-guanine dinucleotide biosynthesis protein A
VIPALLIGREGSVGFPDKNVYPILGKPLMEYPLLAAKGCRSIDAIYVSTDSPGIKEISRSHGARIIDRPMELCTPESLGEDVFVHGYHAIRKSLPSNEGVEMLVLLMCNAPTITSRLIEEGIQVLRAHPDYDSAVSVSRYNMWSPLRARRIGNDELLHPFIPFEAFGNPETLNCDRDSQGDVWFADMGASIVRPRNLEHLVEGLLPQKWMGRRIYPLKQWGGLDIDYEWQLPQVRFWLEKHGHREVH